jgi:hypothetical protein
MRGIRPIPIMVGLVVVATVAVVIDGWGDEPGEDVCVAHSVAASAAQAYYAETGRYQTDTAENSFDLATGPPDC